MTCIGLQTVSLEDTVLEDTVLFTFRTIRQFVLTD